MKIDNLQICDKTIAYIYISFQKNWSYEANISLSELNINMS